MAAKFEFETMKNASSSRALLQQGIRANPESKHLWMEVGHFRGGCVCLGCVGDCVIMVRMCYEGVGWREV